MNPSSYTAYVPCFNNAATLEESLRSVLAQTIKPVDLWVIDDGSTDDTRRILEGTLNQHLKVVHHQVNMGRGAARARAMEESTNDLVLCCDATNALEPDFAAKSMKWFESPSVASVHGVLRQKAGGNAAQRWRGRHLFKQGDSKEVSEHATLSTWGAMVRKSAALKVGNYSPECRHSEDAELGGRLNKAGFKTVFDPAISLCSISRNSVGQVLERYWRWYAGVDERVSAKGYLKSVVYSAKVMAALDLREKDPASALISLLCPHYQFWRSAVRRINRARQSATTK